MSDEKTPAAPASGADAGAAPAEEGNPPEPAEDALPASEAEESPAAEFSGGPPPAPRSGGRSARPALSENREPVYREVGGFRLRLEPADLARLRELPGSRGRSDRELGEEFFEKQAERFAQSLAEDVAPPAEVRVVVDPYSRQAFLAVERTIRSILSF
jgi:hypothetical protein